MAENCGFRQLVAWQVGMDVVELTYRLTGKFPIEERYGLVSQMRRAAVSVPSNIAESQPATTPKWTLRYINNAIGSSCELDTQIEASISPALLLGRRHNIPSAADRSTAKIAVRDAAKEDGGAGDDRPDDLRACARLSSLVSAMTCSVFAHPPAPARVDGDAYFAAHPHAHATHAHPHAHAHAHAHAILASPHVLPRQAQS